MKNPEISVIMPAYNAGKFLDESIQSIINQTFKDFEFIIIDDGSTDNSLKIIKKYMEKDKKILLIKNPKNLGLQKTLNRGLEMAKGKYIARMDADDISLPERFEVQYNYLEKHPEIFLVGSSAIVIDENGNRLGVFEKDDSYQKIKKRLLKSNCLVHPSIMFRNRGFLYREKFKTSEDYDLHLRLLTDGKKLVNIPQNLIKYRISENSFVSTKPNQDFYFRKALEFYWQRIKYGQDDYELLSDPIKKMPVGDFKKNFMKIKIFVQLLDGQQKNVRKEIKSYFEKYGFDAKFLFYYIISFFPVVMLRVARRLL